ncbi:hypothetical protein ACWC9T_40160 [Kitasatospora sp. NPDC001159]
MNNTTKVALGVAVAGGYVLGRMKKGRLAFAVATFIAGRRVGLDPRQLATEGLNKLREIPQVAGLSEQVKGELLETGKKALAAAASRRIGELADSLHERTLNIGKPKPKAEEPEDEDENQEEPARERTARRRAATSGGRAGRASRSTPRAEPESSPERKLARKAPRKSAPAAKKAPAKTAPPAKRSAGRAGSAKGG